MTESVYFAYEGAPVAKQRAIVVDAGDHKIAFTPEKTRKYEQGVGYAARQAMKGRPLLLGPLELRIVAALPIPASWSKKKRALALAGEVMPITRPDVDNLVKTICDALNCVVYPDDKQVARLTIDKIYSARPGIEVQITPIEGGAKRRPEAGMDSGRQFREGGQTLTSR